MSTPNILQVSTIIGKTSVLNVSTTPTAIVSNLASSNTVHKVNALVVANVDGINACDITVDLYRDATAYRIINTVSVAADSSFIAIGRDYPIYIEEGDSLRLTASANGDLTGVCSYEVIS